MQFARSLIVSLPIFLNSDRSNRAKRDASVLYQQRGEVAGAAVSMGMEVEGKLGARLGAARVASLYNNVEEGISQGKMIFLRKNREKKSQFLWCYKNYA